MNSYISAVFYGILTSFFFVTDCYGQSKSFRVFDAIAIHDKPKNFSYVGLSKLNMIYESSLLMANPRSPKNGNLKIIDREKVSRVLNKIDPTYPVCLDVESWVLDSTHVKESSKKYRELLSLFKEQHPNTERGYYGLLPTGYIFLDKVITSTKTNSFKRALDNWNYLNSNLEDISALSTIAFPSCYTKYKDRSLWLQVLKMNVKKIKEINPLIKIYPFIWPQYYYPGSKHHLTEIESDFWKFQLEEIYKLCDGVVIWHAPVDLATKEVYKWNDKANWWRTTTKFIKNKNIKSNSR